LEKIENQIRYIIENLSVILKQSKQAIANLDQSLSWISGGPSNDFFDSIQLSKTNTSKDLFILKPHFVSDPYSDWAIHFYDKNGPTIRKIVRNDDIIA
jgi:hypothetical protein